MTNPTKLVVLEMKKDKSISNKSGMFNTTFPFVVHSDFHEFKPNSRFDWGYMELALSEGYSVIILPEYEEVGNVSRTRES